MITYTGVHVTQDYGVPTLQDIAVQTMRLCRFCGSGQIFWPVGMHLLLVAELLPPELKHHGLLHDAAEACVNDVPRPMKTAEAKALEARITARIYHSLGLQMPTEAEALLIHEADMRAVNVEGRLGPGPRGYEYLQPNIDYTDQRAVDAILDLLTGYDPAQCLDANGVWVKILERDLTQAVHKAHKTFDAVKSYTSPA